MWHLDGLTSRSWKPPHREAVNVNVAGKQNVDCHAKHTFITESTDVPAMCERVPRRKSDEWTMTLEGACPVVRRDVGTVESIEIVVL